MCVTMLLYYGDCGGLIKYCAYLSLYHTDQLPHPNKTLQLHLFNSASVSFYCNHLLVFIFSYSTYMSCVLVWFPLLEAGCGGLEQLCVFVLAVWYGVL